VPHAKRAIFFNRRDARTTTERLHLLSVVWLHHYRNAKRMMTDPAPLTSKLSAHIYEVHPRNDKRGVDFASFALHTAMTKFCQICS
jgi:hypothetical protein